MKGGRDIGTRQERKGGEGVEMKETFRKRNELMGSHK